MTTASKVGIAVIVAVAVGAGLFVLRRSKEPAPSTERDSAPEASYVGSRTCRNCHEGLAEAWASSHHALAMQPATAETVLADFDDASFEYAGTESRFFKRGATFFVRTDGRDGKLADFEVRYTFGVDPLQQYLVEIEPGRLQALPIAWDTRVKEQGGQRWFHLHPNERVTAGDALHWTTPSYNWNNACADCHSTGVQKNYDRAARRYDTTYEEVTVGCEACHGPGSVHVARAEAEVLADGFGFDRVLSASNKGSWSFVPERDIAVRSSAPGSDELETCAPCHSRRSDLGGPPAEYHDRYRLALLDQGLYHSDGQILDEVFVYGSFLQSKMHGAGVMCTDCHQAHGPGFIAEGNALCTRCHKAAVFDAQTHHFHTPDSDGALCTSCHMPERTYMVIDRRADHRLGVPRPEMSERTGVPNACNDCHDDKSAQWAANSIAEHTGRQPSTAFGDALFEARRQTPGADRALVTLAFSRTEPGIVRATAVTELGAFPSPALPELLNRAAKDTEPLVRRAAAIAARQLPGAQRQDLLLGLLRDPVRSVRVEALPGLFGTNTQAWNDADREAFVRASDEYRQTRQFAADRGQGLADLAHLAALGGDQAQAESTLREAIEIDPTFSAAYINLADLYRLLGQDDRGEAILREGLKVAADTAAVQHALGLTLVRLGRKAEALESLGAAFDLSPENLRYGYVYAIALFDQRRPGRAIEVLERLHGEYRGNQQLLQLLVSYHRELGQLEEANGYEAKLRALAQR